MKKQTRDILIGGLLVCAAVVSLRSAFFGGSPKIELGTYQALGAVTAEETAKLLGTKGRVLVIARDTGADKNPSVEAELAAFEQTLKKHGGLRQVTERFVATPMLMMATGGSVPPDRLSEALAAHTDIGALVLFCAFPPLADADLDALRKRGVKTVVVSSFRPEYARLMEQGIISLAIVPRPEPPPAGAPQPRTLRELFDQDYAILAPQDGVSGG